MKRIEINDLKPGYYWLKDRKEGSFEPVRVYTGFTGHLYYLMTGNECEDLVTENEEFFELIAPVVGQTELFSKTYDGESIVDMGRDISECLDERFNPVVKEIPEMEDSPDFWAGKFVVEVKWVPENDNS